MFLYAFTVILLFIYLIVAHPCANPPPASNFNLKNYQGKWYQIAKYQTAGGAYFQKNCSCTEIDVSQNTNSTIYALQSCRKNGKISSVNATLIPTQIQGKYIEKISVNKVGYWVIQLDESTAIQYDCQQSLGVTNYCVHIMSRKTSMSTQKLEQLSNFALNLGLNSQNLPRTITDQEICRQQSNLISQTQ